ncbi:MAG TPA: NIF family HAD-type phosphatase [Candidatus Absconditabacterales bacterium]|nr:NIF family HAD-type phosphatase [Candidatus Absconditabacterales bacterium]
MEKIPCVIFDLDGTLCELGDSPNPYNHEGTETIRVDIYKELMKVVDKHYIDIIILTGRKRNEYGEITERWLSENDIPYNLLIMQEGNTAEKNEIYKEKELIKLKENYNIIMMYDDNPKVGEVCEKLGIPFYHCY